MLLRRFIGVKTYHPGSIWELQTNQRCTRRVRRSNSRLKLLVLVVHPSGSHCAGISIGCPEIHRSDPTYAGAPRPSFRSTCCRTCLRLSRFRPWCHLRPVSRFAFYLLLQVERTNVLYSRTTAISGECGRVGARVSHTCIWWPYSCERRSIGVASGMGSSREYAP